MSCLPCKAERIRTRHAQWLAGVRDEWSQSVSEFYRLRVREVLAARARADAAVLAATGKSETYPWRTMASVRESVDRLIIYQQPHPYGDRP